MAFGQQSGPPASHRQLAELAELLERAGHSDFRDARGPMGFTQRQAGGKFTSDEADEFIAALQEAEYEAEEEAAPPPRRRAGATKTPPTTSAAFDDISDDDLAAELQRRGWVVMKP